MGTLFRSEKMTLCQLFLQNEVAYSCVSELGELGLVQFRDLNPDVNAFQRKYVSEIRRCDDLQRKLRYLEKEIKQDGIPILDLGDNPEAPSPPEMVEMETNIEKCEEDLKEINRNYNQLRKNHLELTEMKYVLRKAQNFFEESVTEGPDAGDDVETGQDLGYLVMMEQREMRIDFYAGVISRERLPGFERLLWRACRGTAFLRTAEIEVPLEDPTGGSVHKAVVLIFFQGDQLKSRIAKICDSFHVNRFPCPETEEARREAAIGVMTRLEDLNLVLNQTREHRHRVLVAAAQNLKLWNVKTAKIKAIYHALNMFNIDVTNKCLIGECWCPVDDLGKIQAALNRGTERAGGTVQPILNRMQTSEPPPTYNRVNKYTKVFQSMVNSYGVARYQEANPAPFSIITFPFLFAVMFGDCGHGLLMFLGALSLVILERKFEKQRTDDEVWNTFFGGRYIILLMGAFSIYTGLIYNDCFSRSLNIFGSSWYPVYPATTVHLSRQLQLNPTPGNDSMYSGNPYPFGLDPVWQSAKNKIAFTNSFKMKMSVILGVSQMIFGVCLSCTNHVYFKDWLSLWCEFIPQIIFISSIFLYLIILIFYKWIKYTAATSHSAPSLLIGLIDMFMFKHPASVQMYTGQAYVEDILVVLAVICVPWMLLVKPLILRHRYKVEQTQYQRLQNHASNGNLVNHTDDEEPSNQSSEEKHEEPTFRFSDVFVHQAIHTIEYCLGCISNTASYLRLWALSLAHAQLSEVLWEMVLKLGLRVNGVWGFCLLFPIFALWAVLTVGILLLMEGLSAFLHALRLHWVEFQNKFYHGTGYIFVPFYLDPLLLEIPEE